MLLFWRDGFRQKPKFWANSKVQNIEPVTRISGIKMEITPHPEGNMNEQVYFISFIFEQSGESVNYINIHKAMQLAYLKMCVLKLFCYCNFL